MTWSDPLFANIASFASERTGLVFPPHRRTAIELSIRKLMADRGLTDLGRYDRLVRMSAEALDDLIVELTIGETYFFREPDQFEFIRSVIIPEIRQRRGADHLFRAWSAACASGEEAYSLAILLLETATPFRHLLATDISRSALAKARRGEYGEWSLRGDGAVAARRHLRPEGKRWRLDDNVRRRVDFQYLNLSMDVYPSFASGTWGMDLILCRNVLIYFDREMSRQVSSRLAASLAPGGWLIQGSSDPPPEGVDGLRSVVTEKGVFYQQTTSEKRGIPSDTRDLEEALTSRLAELGAARNPRRPAAAGDNRQNADARRQAATSGLRPALTQLTDDANRAIRRVRSLANVDTGQAIGACKREMSQFPLSTELAFLHAMLLVELGEDQQAAQSLRRVLYLDRMLAMPYFVLGGIARRLGDSAGARRSFRQAWERCNSLTPTEIVPLSDGEPAGRLRDAAAAELALLGEPVG